MNDIPKKPKKVLNRSKTKVPMREQAPMDRIMNFEEVPLGYNEIEATQEALRCINCKDKPCVAGCPVGIDIPAFLLLVGKKDYEGALRKIKEKNFLPAICGRVCPQEDQCEMVCTLNKPDKGREPGGVGHFKVLDIIRQSGGAAGRVTINNHDGGRIIVGLRGAIDDHGVCDVGQRLCRLDGVRAGSTDVKVDLVGAGAVGGVVAGGDGLAKGYISINPAVAK